jgi:hypothetical protein
MANQSLSDRYVSMLMDRLRETSYPSPPMLDRIEAAITDRQVAEAYVSALLDRIEQERFPSPTMLDRLRGLIAVCER